ncbi:unnamed protein product [Closterium sp. NIES-65]|nr:unnamed protein product [Closterium sp. NIES-65]
MSRETPPSLAMLLLAIILSATIVAVANAAAVATPPAPAASNYYSFDPAANSLTFGTEYTIFWNAMLTGPANVVVTNGTGARSRMGKTAFLANGTIMGASGKPIIPTLNADGPYVAGDLKGWPNGTIVGSTGATIYLAALLSLSPNGTVGYTPPPLPPPTIKNGASNYYAFNPATNSLTIGPTLSTPLAHLSKPPETPTDPKLLLACTPPMSK